MDDAREVREWERDWSRARCDARSLGRIERWQLRRAIAALYDGAGLRAPARQIWVDSPITGAIAGALAGGARWVLRHPEAHAPLFGHALADNELAHAMRVAASELTWLAAATSEDSPPLDRATDAVLLAACAAAGVDDLGGAIYLPAKLRPRLRALKSTTDAPRLAATEGWLDGHLTAITHELRDRVIAAAGRTTMLPEWLWHLHSGAGVVTRSIQRAARRPLRRRELDDPVATFLTATAERFAEGRAALDVALDDLVPLSFARRRRAFDLDYRAWAPLERLARSAAPAFLHADFAIVADRPSGWDPLLRWRDGWGAALVAHDHREQTPRWVLTWPLDAARPWQRVVDVDMDPLGRPMRLLQLGTVRGKPRLVLEMHARGRLRWYRVPPTLRSCSDAISRTYHASHFL